MRQTFDSSDGAVLVGLMAISTALYLSWGLPAALAFVGLLLVAAGSLNARK